jgi:S-adenosylmethionine:tRNA ribosyltransferase-isomerase
MHLALDEPGPPQHRAFRDLPALLKRGDLLVVNDTKVMAARIEVRRATGGKVELLLLEPGPGVVEALARPARKLKPGARLDLPEGGQVEVLERLSGGRVRLRFDEAPAAVMARSGSMPLPPYLKRAADPTDRVRYQTMFAGPLGASAAPTAGLHFTPRLLSELARAGVDTVAVTLHVGIGTFRPLRGEDLQAGVLHSERYVVSPTAAARMAEARRSGGRVIAVGTTVARTLEAATPADGRLPLAGSGTTNIFIRPPYAFRAIDGLITNFHLPRSSLLMLVASFVGRERMFAAYQTAIEDDYRFYSYGDAMLLL